MASYSGKGVPVNGSVYVCNLPHGTDENMLAEYFGTIGLLKVGGLTRYFLASCFVPFLPTHNLYFQMSTFRS